jgi:hypothetical protein
MTMNLVSVCIAAYDKPRHLDRALASIFRQQPTFPLEVIVVDDGSPNGDVRQVCARYPLRYERIERSPGYRNPSRARNRAAKLARGHVLVMQSDDVEHQGEALTVLVDALRPGTMAFATILNVNPDTGLVERKPLPCFCSPKLPRPLFFLGALYRRDFYAVGGNDERFVAPAYEDTWLADCLHKGAGLSCTFTEALAHHLSHERPQNQAEAEEPSRVLFHELRRRQVYHTEDAPWPTLPPTMNFFWTGPMPWLHYVTLLTFRRFNPDWRCVLWQPAGEVWSDRDDSDWRNRVEELGVERCAWVPPVRSPDVGPAQLSDLFQWWLLGTEGGWYSDMDAVWLQPLDPLLRCAGAVDSLWCMEVGRLAIGLFAARPGGCTLFRTFYDYAIKQLAAGGYQRCGTDTLYAALNVQDVKSHRWLIPAKLQELCQRIEPDHRIYVAPDYCYYPILWCHCKRLWRHNDYVDSRAYALHWFGGDRLAKEAAETWTPANWRQRSGIVRRALEVALPPPS